MKAKELVEAYMTIHKMDCEHNVIYDYLFCDEIRMIKYWRLVESVSKSASSENDISKDYVIKNSNIDAVVDQIVYQLSISGMVLMPNEQNIGLDMIAERVAIYAKKDYKYYH